MNELLSSIHLGRPTHLSAHPLLNAPIIHFDNIAERAQSSPTIKCNNSHIDAYIQSHYLQISALYFRILVIPFEP